MNSEIRFYLSLLWQRLPVFLLICLPIAVGTIFVAMNLPATYRAQMRLVVESSQIPDALAQSTVDTPAQEQLQMFQTRLMTRDNLLDIAAKLKPIPGQDAMAPDEIVQEMRDATSITSSSGTGQATLMTVSFDSHDPAMTVKVLDAYLTFLLAQDAQYRSQRAGQTQDFFQQEVNRLSSALSQQSAQIVDFKNKHADALPDSLDYHRELMLNLQGRLTQLDSERASLVSQKQRLTQVFETTGSIGAGTGAQLTPEQQRLQQLKSQLADMEAVYAPGNPKVVTLRNRIAQLEANVAAAGGTQAETDPTRALFKAQIEDIDEKIQQIDTAKGNVQDQSATVQDQIDRTPANAVALDSLQRDYDNLQSQYDRAADSLSRASTGERIETLSRGQRMSVVERASQPTIPIKPNRKKLAAMGVIAGLVIAGGVILALDVLSGTIKRSRDLVNGLGITPMVTIPMMLTEQEAMAIQSRRLMISVAIGIMIPILLWITHHYYMPFDVLASRIAERIGIRL